MTDPNNSNNIIWSTYSSFEQQKVPLEWIKWYGHPRKIQGTKIRRRLNVTSYVYFLCCKNLALAKITQIHY